MSGQSASVGASSSGVTLALPAVAWCVTGCVRSEEGLPHGWRLQGVAAGARTAGLPECAEAEPWPSGDEDVASWLG
jgi:hypothetical protein